MELPFSLFAFLLILASVSASILKRMMPKVNKKLPPSPWKLPFVGNLHHLVGSPAHLALAKLAQKHGALMQLKLGEIRVVVVSSPCLAKEIMKTHDLAFANRGQILAAKIVCYNGTDIACSPYGEYWRQMRQICTQQLLVAERVRSFHSIRQDEAMHLISSIHALAGTGIPINLTQELLSYASSMVFRAAFGKVSKQHKDAFLQELKKVLPLVTCFDISDLFPSYEFFHRFSMLRTEFMKVRKRVDAIFDSIINEHLDSLACAQKDVAEPRHECLLDVLLRVKDSGDLRIPITYDNIKAVLIDVFAGGTETSSTTIEWAISEMIRNPSVLAKAQGEVRKEFKGKNTIAEADIQKLKYLKLVIKETLRLHPPSPLLMPKECREQCEIDGYVIPTKTRVLVNAWAIGRDPEFWDDPECFKPERFENSPVDFTGTHFEYIPFGAGRRMCPGISFGMANVELVLALLLHRFDWKLPHGLKPEDLDMSESSGFSATRRNNLCLLADLQDH